MTKSVMPACRSRTPAPSPPKPAPMMATRTCSGTVSASQTRRTGGRFACERDLGLGEPLSLADDHATTVHETAPGRLVAQQRPRVVPADHGGQRLNASPHGCASRKPWIRKAEPIDVSSRHGGAP